MQAPANTFLAGCLILACGPPAWGQGAATVGGEFQVNSDTAHSLSLPAIAPLAGNGFVVAWASRASGAYSSDIQGRLYDAGGTAIGPDFQVNSDTFSSLWRPAVAGLNGGGFVALWTSSGSAGTDVSVRSVQGQLYGADGEALGAQFQVNSWTTSEQTHPSAAALADGGFVVMWTSLGSSGSDTSESSIQGQLYDAGGMARGGEFQVNTYTSNWQSLPSVAALADGGFVAAWSSWGSDGSDTIRRSIQGRQFTASGAGVGPDFQVNTYTSGGQYRPSVAALAGGDFVVAWTRLEGGGHYEPTLSGIHGRRFSAAGSPAGPQFQINTYTDNYQGSAVTATAGDGFVVVWQSWGSSGSDSSWHSIQGRRFGDDGQALGGELQVNTYTFRDQEYPSATAVGDDFMVVWHSDGGDASESGIRGQRFAAPRFALTDFAGKCLEVEAADPPVGLSDCHGGENQRWWLDLTAVPQRIRGLGGKCLVPGPTTGAGVALAECGGPDDLWMLANAELQTPRHAEPSVLIHAETGLCLSVASSGAGGPPAILSDCQGGAGQLWRTAAEVCTRDSLGLCLGSERFRVDLKWRSFDGTTGSGRAVPADSDDSGLLWFFEADNWEMLIKVLDGCEINDRFWVFAAATTTVDYTLTVTDTATGEIREYFNPLGNAAAAITDTDAFATCSASYDSAPPVKQLSSAPLRGDGTTPARLEGACVPSETHMCLSDGRFSVDVTWRDYAGNTGSGQVVDASATSGTDDTSGLLWFFNDNNWEMLVKVLDACDVNGQFLFLGAATTDVEFTLTVTDIDAGVTWEHTNPLGQASEALVHWFDTCP